MIDKGLPSSKRRTRYAGWLADLTGRLYAAQQRASLAVNRELLHLGWQIGRDMLARRAEAGWGAKVIDRLTHDLRAAFTMMKDFFRSNLLYIRALAEARAEGNRPTGCWTIAWDTTSS